MSKIKKSGNRKDSMSRISTAVAILAGLFILYFFLKPVPHAPVNEGATRPFQEVSQTQKGSITITDENGLMSEREKIYLFPPKDDSVESIRGEALRWTVGDQYQLRIEVNLPLETEEGIYFEAFLTDDELANPLSLGRIGKSEYFAKKGVHRLDFSSNTFYEENSVIVAARREGSELKAEDVFVEGTFE